MKGLNKATFIGNVGAEDARLGVIARSNTIVANFSLAVNSKWKDGEGNEQTSTTWIDCSIFGKRAEALAPHIKSGMPLFVAGRVGVNAWKGENGEAKGELTLIIGNDRSGFLFLGSKAGDEAPNEGDDQLFTSEG